MLVLQCHPQLSEVKTDKPLLFDTYDSRSNSYVSSQEDNEWYTEDQIRILLERYLLNHDPDSPQYYIAPQTQFEDADLLPKNVGAAITAVNEGITAVIPINLRNNHWVGVIIRRQGDERIEVIYIDPMGNTIQNEPNALLFAQTINTLAPECSYSGTWDWRF